MGVVVVCLVLGIIYRLSEVCRSVAKESRITNNHKKTLCHSGENEDQMVDHQACLNGIPHVCSLLKESQNPGAKKYIKNYRNKYITKSYIL